MCMHGLTLAVDSRGALLFPVCFLAIQMMYLFKTTNQTCTPSAEYNLTVGHFPTKKPHWPLKAAIARPFLPYNFEDRYTLIEHSF